MGDDDDEALSMGNPHESNSLLSAELVCGVGCTRCFAPSVLSDLVTGLKPCKSQNVAEFHEEAQGCGSICKYVSVHVTCIKQETYDFKSIRIL